MPMGWVEAFSAEIDRIEAREALRTAAAVGVGTGSISKREARRMLATWNRAAGFARSQRVDTRTVKGQTALASIFAVETIRGEAPSPLADLAGYRARIQRDRERMLGVTDGRQPGNRGTRT